MQAVALVAHPDDCVIFAWPFIEAHSEFSWTIVYLTYTPWEPRAQEIAHYWDQHNIACLFLGFPDEWESVKHGNLGFDAEQATRELQGIALDYDLILTHHEDGDYGHVHHKFVNAAVQPIATPKVYFASTFNYNVEYVVNTPVDTALLPLHREVIEGFQDRNTGRYIITPQAKELLNENINTR
jgi:LmbE family N-acetylglucosaminyl deacetylase